MGSGDEEAMVIARGADRFDSRSASVGRARSLRMHERLGPKRTARVDEGEPTLGTMATSGQMRPLALAYRGHGDHELRHRSGSSWRVDGTRDAAVLLLAQSASDVF